MSFKITKNLARKKETPCDISFIDKKTAESIRKFHQTFPQYKKTPLRELKSVAATLSVKNIFVKDESLRFGLNAFKVLGGSYAIGNIIAEKLGEKLENLTFEKIISKETAERIGKLTFISATDGNHGRGVAWTANKLFQKCVIYMPKGSSHERLENIRRENAEASITDFNYDDSVRLAAKDAEKNGWILVQDTSWNGYEKIPRWILQGYTTLSLEIIEQLKSTKPTHVFLQAGVGSFASSVVGFLANIYGNKMPFITIVEPNAADCIFKTLQANDGKIHSVMGEMNTIMAGLACGEPVSIGISILRKYVDFCISCPDSAAETGMKILASPQANIISGESGAAPFGCIYEILTNPNLSSMKEMLGLSEESVLLFISTEGDTDKENYKKIVGV